MFKQNQLKNKSTVFVYVEINMIASSYTKTELQRKIPGLTVWKIDMARQHTLQAGPVKSVNNEKQILHRDRMDKGN